MIKSVPVFSRNSAKVTGARIFCLAYGSLRKLIPSPFFFAVFTILMIVIIHTADFSVFNGKSENAHIH